MSVALAPQATAQTESAVSTGPFGRSLAVPRRTLSAVLAASAAMVPLLGMGGVGSAIGLLLLGGLAASALVTDARSGLGRFGVVEWLPTAFLLVVFAVTLLGVAAWWAGTPIWADRAAAMAAWSVLVAVLFALAWWRGGSVALAQRTSPLVVAGVALAAPILALVTVPFQTWSRLVTLGTDFPRHTMIAGRVIDDGWLDYSTSSYPRSVHAAIALAQSASGDTTVAEVWQATQGTLIVMFGLMIVAACFAAAQAARRLGLPPRLADGLVPAVVAFVLVAGVWGTAMLPDGFLTSFEAGLIIAAAATMAWHSDAEDSLAPVLALSALTALMAHAWLILLPLVAAPALWLAAMQLRQRSGVPIVLAIGTLSALVALPIVARSVGNGAVDSIASVGGTRIPPPGLAWLLLVLLAGAGVALLSRRQIRTASTIFMLMGLAFVAVLGFVLYQSGGELLRSYYFIKTAVTPTAWLLGLAVPTVIWGSWRLAHRAARGPRRGRRVSVAAVLAASTLVLLFVGQSAAPGRIMQALTGGLGQPAVFIPLAEQVQSATAHQSQRPEVFVWGLSPYQASDPDSLDRTGRLDYIANGTLLAAGYRIPDGDIVEPLLTRDASGVCKYLQANPTVMRITGPNPDGSLGLLADAGCPDAIVDRQAWIAIDFGPQWFDGTPYADVP